MSNQRVTIEDNRGKGGIEMILGILAAIVVGFVVCGLAPGIFLTSIIDWFVGLEPKTSWGFSIVNTILVYILCRKFSSHFTDLGSTISYAIIAVSTAFLIFLSALFFDYPFPQRTLIRMFGKDVKDEYMTSIGEKKIKNKWRISSIDYYISSKKEKIAELEATIKASKELDETMGTKHEDGENEKLLIDSREELILLESQLDSLKKGY